ncbi:bestrophin family ion channel [Fulvivirgaceae bacterium BMA10]|uniref:Bestrophin family ion channel n=1 Tax=Splendidivirga corallicola TaxID=3051826 RepID=A0ABT8KYP3_9BACT|nr:bestrophin family ion channel [Fulvivirgaceae bacterium BMA10]
MHAGRNFTLKETLIWTKGNILKFTIISAIPVILYDTLGFTAIAVPWLPIALIGTAVAFLIGFKNNASYDRLWESRKIWGAIVNTSRSWGIMVKDYINSDFAGEKLPDDQLHKIHKRLIYRHIAWLTALRYQLRTPRNWESVVHNKANRKYMEKFPAPEINGSLQDELKIYLSDEECSSIANKQNAATQIIALQSDDLRELRRRDLTDDFRHMEMERLLVDFYTHQGKSERIKNYPFPRQYATINLFFVWLFILLVPFGMLPEFEKLGGNFIWLTIPFSVLVSWVFHTTEKIGEASENPFEGSANDIPITALSRTIEIDLREMLGEQDLPESIKTTNNILF